MAESETCLFCCLSLLAGLTQYMPERSHRLFLKIFMFPFNYFDSQNTLQATGTFNLSPGISKSVTGVREWGRVFKEGLKARDLYVILKTGPASHLLLFIIPIPSPHHASMLAPYILLILNMTLKDNCG